MDTKHILVKSLFLLFLPLALLLSCEVEQYNVEKVTLNKTTLKLQVGASETLKATIEPSNATDKVCTWTSNKLAVAKGR